MSPNRNQVCVHKDVVWRCVTSRFSEVFQCRNQDNDRWFSRYIQPGLCQSWQDIWLFGSKEWEDAILCSRGSVSCHFANMSPSCLIRFWRWISAWRGLPHNIPYRWTRPECPSEGDGSMEMSRIKARSRLQPDKPFEDLPWWASEIRRLSLCLRFSLAQSQSSSSSQTIKATCSFLQMRLKGKTLCLSIDVL